MQDKAKYGEKEEFIHINDDFEPDFNAVLCRVRVFQQPASPLLSLSDKEWEDLCDGCGRCCLVKLQDEDTEEIHYTNVACQYLDSNTCRCSDYSNRAKINSRCMVLQRQNLDLLKQMPFTCAYRLVHEGRSINIDSEALSVNGKVVSEEYIHDDQLPDHIVDWIHTDRLD